MNGTTSDGVASVPNHLHVECKRKNDKMIISAKWDPPSERNGLIVNYNLELNGFATYRSERNRDWRNETYGPKTKQVPENLLKADFENVPPNTNYTLKVTAITRSRKPGTPAFAKCSTPHSVPTWNSVPSWESFRLDDKYLIKLYMPELSERNGPICGYRVYLVRMPDFGLDNYRMPPIQRINISTYLEVHDDNNKGGGVYLAETISADSVEREIILGDGNKNLNDGFKQVQNAECRKLLNGYWPASRRTTAANSLVYIPPETPSRIREGMFRNCRIYS